MSSKTNLQKMGSGMLRVGLSLVILVVLMAAALPFMVIMPGQSHEGALAPLTDSDNEVREALERHVRFLSVDVGPRSVWADGIDASRDYIQKELDGFGYEVRLLPYEFSGISVANIEVELKGNELRNEIVLVGAHYDSVDNSPGADDNGSGTAALLELARIFRERKLARTVRFVAFVNEEPPYFQTERMGSLVYAKRCHEREEKIVAMLSVESIGYYRDEPGSQDYPPPFSYFYPDRGNFIGFVGNLGFRSLVRRTVRLFRNAVAFPSEGVAAPGIIPGVGWSDHWAFWEYDVPAVMVTATAPFRNPNYHTRHDSAEKLDYERMARVVPGLAAVISELANTPQ